MCKWCGQEDSNFHGVSPTATSTLRVYQFRHGRKTGSTGWLLAKSRTIFNQMEWKTTNNLVPYESALAEMEARVAQIIAGTAPEMAWFLEHPSLYTGGTSANKKDLIDPDRFPVYETGRGGEYTYHGPGQRVAYVMLNLKNHGTDVRKFVWMLEEWIIRTLEHLNVKGERREGRVGIWVDRGFGKEDKIAAIGIRIRKWVSFHGISINLNPDLSHFSGIIPCGIAQHGVTSLQDLGIQVTMADLDTLLKQTFTDIFGSTQQVAHA